MTTSDFSVEYIYTEIRMTTSEAAAPLNACTRFTTAPSTGVHEQTPGAVGFPPNISCHALVFKTRSVCASYTSSKTITTICRVRHAT